MELLLAHAMRGGSAYGSAAWWDDPARYQRRALRSTKILIDGWRISYADPALPALVSGGRGEG